jgi:hypothetical protein
VAAVAVRTPLHVLCTLRRVVDRRRLYLAACRRLGAVPKRAQPALEFDAPPVAAASPAASSSNAGAAVRAQGLPPMPPVPRWDFGATCGPSRPPRTDVALRALAYTNPSAGDVVVAAERLDAPSAPVMIDGAADDFQCTAPQVDAPNPVAPNVDSSDPNAAAMPAASGAMPRPRGSASDPPTWKGCKSAPSPIVPSSGFDSIEKRARGAPAFSAATHTRVSCARTQVAAVGLAVTIGTAAIAVAAFASNGWCPAAVRRYGVVAAAALAVDCVALQVVWVGGVALWRWMTAPAVGPDEATTFVQHPPYPLHGAWSG